MILLRFEDPSPDIPRLSHKRPGHPVFHWIEFSELRKPLAYPIPDSVVP